MAWSSDIRCLYCDGKLPLYRKITNGQFCSTAHRRLYWQEQERLCVERLHQTHDSLRALQPVEDARALLGPLEAPPPVFKETRATPLPATPIAALKEYTAPPVWGFLRVYVLPEAKWPVDEPRTEPTVLAWTGSVRMPLRSGSGLFSNILAAGIAKVVVAPRSHRAKKAVEPVGPRLLPYRQVTREVFPQGDALAPKQAEESEDGVPRAENLLALAMFAARESGLDHGARREAWAEASFTLVHRALIPFGTQQCGVTLARATPMLAGLRPLSIDQVPLVHGTWIDNLRAMGSEGESPRYELATPALRPRLRLAAGSRYPVATRDTVSMVATAEPRNLQPSGKDIAIPERKAMAAAASVSGKSGIHIPAPGTAGKVPLAMKPNEPASPAALASVSIPQPLGTQPMRPASRLEPLDAKPTKDFLNGGPAQPTKPETKQDEPIPVVEGAGDSETPPVNPLMHVGMHVAGFWKHAPRDLKLLVFGIPILLGLALQPSLKKIPYSAPPRTGGVERTLRTKLNEQLVQVRQTLVDRAAIALDEDFRSGLDDWTSRGGTTEWAFDATGFVRPGPLALYRPSLDLTDYQMQFLGMIDKKALSWVVRAADFDDYYVVKLVIVKPAPLPTVAVTRYAVIHGVAQDRADTTAYINAREDMLYRVKMDIHGDVFALTVQGQMVDSWTEPRLRTGGVGFFTARGEASRLRWVQVTHQYDMLGRLCAYLAPYNIPSTNGGWQP